MSNIMPDRDDFSKKMRHNTTLFSFIKNDKDEHFLEYLLNLSPDEVDLNLKDDHGNLIIFFAVIKNKKKILQKIIDYNARLDVLDTDGFSLLYYPIKFNYHEIIDILLEANKKIIGLSLINIKDNRGGVPLFYAIKYRNEHALQELLIQGADVNYKNDNDANSLHLAVLKKDNTLVRMLLKYIKNIDSRTKKGSTALHYACNFQLYDIIKTLLEHGARQDIVEYDYDFYPIFYCVVQNDFDSTKLLLDYGANCNWQDHMGNTIIHYCIMDNNLEMLHHIFNKISVISIKNQNYTENINNTVDGIEPRISTTPSINKSYIDPNVVNMDGLTVGHMLLYQYKQYTENKQIYYDIMGKILPHANLNYQDNNGNTLLHILVENTIWPIFHHILKTRKMNIYIKNNSDQTVLSLLPLKDRDDFIGIVSQSYMYYLKRHKDGWIRKWENQCSNPQTHETSVVSSSDLFYLSDQQCLDLIKKFIADDKISVPTKKTKKLISLDTDNLIQFNTFTGSLLDIIVGFKYLINKYRDTATILHSYTGTTEELQRYNQLLGLMENSKQHLIHFEIRWIYQKIFFPPNFENIIEKIVLGAKHKYLIIPIGIILSNGNHSNALIYNIESHIMERFEPHGSSYPNQFNYNPELLDEILIKRFTHIFSSVHKLTHPSENYILTYVRPRDYLPKIGFQSFEHTEININKNIGDPNGFCTLWCIWYLDYRIKYSDFSPKIIVKKLINQIKRNDYSFRTIIRNYSVNITDLRDKYLTTIGKNINDYLNNRLNANDLTVLLDQIVNEK